jgi:hypothetical protein
MKDNVMKKINLAISELSFEQKLGLMEVLWEELTRDEKKLKSPPWHETILKDREEAFSSGKVTVSDWDQAKKRIKKKVSCA